MSARPFPALAVVLALAALAASAAAQQPLSTYTYTDANAQFGWSVDVVGDLDDDGCDDLVVGAPRAGGSNHFGSIRVLSGRTGGLIWREYGTTDSRAGEAVANLGDLDGDGFDDVAEGAPFAAMGGVAKGYVRFWSGRTNEVIHLVGGTSLPDLARFGADVDGIGDIDEDGVPDVAVGIPGLAVSGMLAAGEVWIHSGKDGAVIRKHSGTQAAAVYGERVAAAGDVDGDGVGDLLIGAPGHDLVGSNSGRVEVRSGRTGGLLFAVIETEANAQLGAAVDGAGDVNQDGYADVIVGAPGASEGLGEVKLFLGPGGELAWTLTGQGVGPRYGQSVAGVGDVDRDGHDDVAIGFENGFEVRSGRTGAVLYTPVAGSGQDTDLGFSLAGGGDFDGDGWVDVLAGAPSGGGGVQAGIARGYDVLFRQPDLGLGGPGVALLELAGSPLDSFGQADARVRQAPPNKSTALVVGFANASVPFKGGILVPDASGAVITWTATDAEGAATVPGFPGGGGPFEIFLQALVADLSQPGNYTFSNAVRGEFLP